MWSGQKSKGLPYIYKGMCIDKIVYMYNIKNNTLRKVLFVWDYTTKGLETLSSLLKLHSKEHGHFSHLAEMGEGKADASSWYFSRTENNIFILG